MAKSFCDMFLDFNKSKIRSLAALYSLSKLPK
nr:MAG TPA: glycoprotein [Caudoviricetes sp.]